MAANKFPKFFAPSSKQPLSLHADGSREPIALLDNFFTTRSFGLHAEWILATDQAGRLQLYSGEERSKLPSELQAQLAFNEVASEGRMRLLDVVSLFLFRTQYINQPTNMVGLNDPLCLFGTIYEVKPFLNESCLGDGIEGTLTVSRSDLLNGISNGAGYAFHLGNRDEGSEDLRCMNALLPGDRVENVSRGHGLVLTYPMMPMDMEPGNTHNEVLVSQLIYDVLVSLQKDLVAENHTNLLTSRILPVPSRIALEDDLRVKGYTISGDIAKRKRATDANHPVPLLNAIVDLFAAESIRLPPEARPGELLAIVEQVIESLPGWPSNVSLATNKRCMPSNEAFRDKNRRHR